MHQHEATRRHAANVNDGGVAHPEFGADEAARFRTVAAALDEEPQR
jgi:hypothetical protein